MTREAFLGSRASVTSTHKRPPHRLSGYVCRGFSFGTPYGLARTLQAVRSPSFLHPSSGIGPGPRTRSSALRTGVRSLVRQVGRLRRASSNESARRIDLSAAQTLRRLRRAASRRPSSPPSTLSPGSRPSPGPRGLEAPVQRPPRVHLLRVGESGLLSWGFCLLERPRGFEAHARSRLTESPGDRPASPRTRRLPGGVRPHRLGPIHAPLPERPVAVRVGRLVRVVPARTWHPALPYGVSLRFPAPPFSGSASTLQNPYAHIAGRSRHLETAFRSPTAGIPFQALPRRGRCSRPVSSLPHQPLALTVDPGLPSSPACLLAGKLVAHGPFPDTRLMLPIARRSLAPLWGYFYPSGL
jgi:hypothetical protein